MSGEVDVNEILITPIATLIRELSKSVADAQLQLDAAALASQNALPTELRDLGYEPTWYQMPEAQVEIKMAVHYERSQPTGPVRAWATPFNAKYRNAQNYTADGSSTLTLRIVPVPPHVADKA